MPSRRRSIGSVSSRSTSVTISAGRPERADCVLCPGQVDRDLAADRRVGLGKPRRRHVYQRHAPTVKSGGQPTDVAHRSAAGNDQRVGALGADRGQPVKDLSSLDMDLASSPPCIEHRRSVGSASTSDGLASNARASAKVAGRPPYRGFDQSAEATWPRSRQPMNSWPCSNRGRQPLVVRPAPTSLTTSPSRGIAADRDVDGPIERLAFRRRSRAAPR